MNFLPKFSWGVYRKLLPNFCWRVFKKFIVYFRKNVYSNTGPFIDETTLVEEETFPFYEPQQYRNVNIGDIYHDQYQVLGKLGYGAYSTSWLCRDLWSFGLLKHSEEEYVALKVSTFLDDKPLSTYRESKIIQHILKTMLESSHPGRAYIRYAYGQFNLGQHQCLLLEPMFKDMGELMTWKDSPLDFGLTKLVICTVLSALDFLHTEAKVVHTDIKADNIILRLKGQSLLKRFEEEELHRPSPRKRVDATRNIYESRKIEHSSGGGGVGNPALCDFGEARIGTSHESGYNGVQPDQNRAPEVMFSMEWGMPIDIWSVACLTWDLFEGQHLFTSIHVGKEHDPFRHLAKMVGIIGPPPTEFVARSEHTSQCFDEEGQWILEDPIPVVPTRLEDIERRFARDGREKEMFLAFMRRMLRWLPEERATALELLQDPWLYEITRCSDDIYSHDRYIPKTATL